MAGRTRAPSGPSVRPRPGQQGDLYQPAAADLCTLLSQGCRTPDGRARVARGAQKGARRSQGFAMGPGSDAVPGRGRPRLAGVGRCVSVTPCQAEGCALSEILLRKGAKCATAAGRLAVVARGRSAVLNPRLEKGASPTCLRPCRRSASFSSSLACFFPSSSPVKIPVATTSSWCGRCVHLPPAGGEVQVRSGERMDSSSVIRCPLICQKWVW